MLGSDEGVYAWVVANYALGTLGGDPLQTTGIIELGGASAQVCFAFILSIFSTIWNFGLYGLVPFSLSFYPRVIARHRIFKRGLNYFAKVMLWRNIEHVNFVQEH